MNLSEDIAELPSPHCISYITARRRCFGPDSRGWNVLVARSFEKSFNVEPRRDSPQSGTESIHLLSAESNATSSCSLRFRAWTFKPIRGGR